MLTGGADSVEATGVPPEGFVRLAPAARQAPANNHREGARSGGGVILSFLVAVGAGMASLQTLIPWAPLGESLGRVVAGRPDRRAKLVEANGVTRS